MHTFNTVTAKMNVSFFVLLPKMPGVHLTPQLTGNGSYQGEPKNTGALHNTGGKQKKNYNTSK